jgi:predicted outer membrane lipoprotein
MHDLMVGAIICLGTLCVILFGVIVALYGQVRELKARKRHKRGSIRPIEG